MRILAHRGAEAYAPENTFAAFSFAADLHADGIETDVQSTKDGKLVLFHDAKLERTTNGKGLLHEKNWHEIENLDAGLWFDKKYKGEKIPVLNDFLNTFCSNTITDLEIKQPNIEEAVFEAVSGRKLLTHITFTSFNFPSLLKIRKLSKQAKLGWLTNDASLASMEKAIAINCTQFSPPVKLVTNELVELLHTYGFFVRVWGVTNMDLMLRALKAGVDGMTIGIPGVPLSGKELFS